MQRQRDVKLVLEPWQTGYGLSVNPVVEDFLPQLADALSQTSRMLEDFCKAQWPAAEGAGHADKALYVGDPVSQLRLLGQTDNAIDYIQELYRLLSHQLKCHTFVIESTKSLAGGLPDNVLARIFLMANNMHRRKATNAVSGRRGRPEQVHVAAVCKHWQRVAHNVPSLWSEICWDREVPRTVINAWICRSYPAPMKLTLGGTPCLTRKWQRQQLNLLNYVCENGQLESLVLQGHAGFLKDVAVEWTAAAPCLKELEMNHLDGRCRRRPKVEGTYLRAPRTLSSLRRLTFQSARAPLMMVTPVEREYDDEKPDSRLEHLKLEYSVTPHGAADLEGTLRLLRSTPKLVQLELTNVFGVCSQWYRGWCDCKTTPSKGAHDPVQLPRLKSLTLWGDPRCCWSWVGLLNVPRLKKAKGPPPNDSWDKWIRWKGRTVPVLPPMPPTGPIPLPMPHPLESMGFVREEARKALEVRE